MLQKASSPRASVRTFDIQPDGREALQLSAALWIGATAFVGIGAIVVGNIRYVGEYITLVTGLISAISIAFGLYLVLRALAGRPRWLAYAILPFAIVTASILQSVLDYGGFHLVNRLLPTTRLPAIDATGWLMVVVINACLYSTNVALLWLTSANRAMRDQAARLARSEADALRAELQVLRLKLNPHFMFNALGAATGLIGAGRPAESEAMLNRLSGFLRTTFDVGTEDIPLRDELSIVDDYLEVERVRFGDRMRVRMDVEEALNDALVPSLLLQPLIENAVRYGVAPSSSLVTIVVRARRVGDQLVLTVEEDGRPATGEVAHGTGLGQAATRSRLAMRYGEAADFTAGREGGLYRAVVRIPWTTTRAEAERRAA